MLFHISEESGISGFEPRASALSNVPVVWAIDAERLRNYLVPRECPRVTFYAGPETTASDRERFLGTASAVFSVIRMRNARPRTTHSRDRIRTEGGRAIDL